MISFANVVTALAVVAASRPIACGFAHASSLAGGQLISATLGLHASSALEGVAPASPLLGDRPWILLLGDSIVEESADPAGWGASLAAWYSRRADVLFRGFGGATSRHLRALVSGHLSDSGGAQRLLLGSERVLLVVLCVGANDASAPGRPSHVPLSEYVQNLDAMLKVMAMALPSAEVLLVTPPAVDVEALASQPWYHADGRDAERTESYARAVMELAAAKGYPAFNLYATMLGEGDGWQRLLRDGLHLSGQGNALLFAGLQAIISTHPRLRLRQREMLPTHLPVDPVKLADALNRTRVDCAWPGKVAGQTWFC